MRSWINHFKYLLLYKWWQLTRAKCYQEKKRTIEQRNRMNDVVYLLLTKIKSEKKKKNKNFDKYKQL